LVSFRVDFSHQAAKILKRLDRTTALRIHNRIEELATEPFSPRLSRQKETMPENRYSRVGDWRIIYQINEKEGVLNIVAIRPRSSAYQ
jgi:mRNA interferase RelE/StbE